MGVSGDSIMLEEILHEATKENQPILVPTIYMILKIATDNGMEFTRIKMQVTARNLKTNTSTLSKSLNWLLRKGFIEQRKTIRSGKEDLIWWSVAI